MPLLAESLVEEWLNREGYFTIRDVKHGLGEMDLLAVPPESDGVVGRYVEVTVSFRPIGYIAPERFGASGSRGSYVRKRTPQQVQVCARAYVGPSFAPLTKFSLRAQLWPGVICSFHLVHGLVRYPDELSAFAHEGVNCHPSYPLLSDLSQRDSRSSSGSASGDLAEIFKRTGKVDSRTNAILL
jgi:hypothetical protein